MDIVKEVSLHHKFLSEATHTKKGRGKGGGEEEEEEKNAPKQIQNHNETLLSPGIYVKTNPPTLSRGMPRSRKEKLSYTVPAGQVSLCHLFALGANNTW